MVEERELAQEGGYESPIWDTIEKTHECYNQSLSNIIENIDEDCLLLLGSHNIDSVTLAKSKIEERGLKEAHCVRFGQLKGFSDHLTAELSGDDFKVSKFIPYGPTQKVIPYLIRRGQESR